MNIVIGILTSEHGRYSRFWNSMINLATPKNTKIITKLSIDIAKARNEVLQECGNPDFVWFIDDDHTFDGDILQNLVNRNVPIVQPLVLSRYFPFGPVMMGAPIPEKPGYHARYALDDKEQTGLKEVEVVGCGGMLIRGDVIKKIGSNWFQNPPDKVAEDVSFCHKAKEKGFKIYCDLSNTMGHLNVGDVRPVVKDGKWVTQLTFGSGVYYMPKAEPKL